MSVQGYKRAPNTLSGELASSSSMADVGRGGAGSSQERVGNSGMAERLGLRGAAQETDPASATVRRPAWLGADGADEALLAEGRGDPPVFRLALPQASRRLERAMAAFEARVRPADEAAWMEWFQKEWLSVVRFFNTIQGTEQFEAAELRVHATQSGRENRAINRSYVENLEELLAGDALFTWHDFKALEDIHVSANADNGKHHSLAAAGNGTEQNRSKSNGGAVFVPGYDSKSKSAIEQALASFNDKDIAFFQAPSPGAMTEEQFSVFAEENSYVLDEDSLRGDLYPIVKFLRENPGRCIRVVGRSDFDLSAINLPNGARTMGLARARTIRDILVGMGAKAEQMDIDGEAMGGGDARGLGVKLYLQP